jgi:hypothetical protein
MSDYLKPVVYIERVELENLAKEAYAAGFNAARAVHGDADTKQIQQAFTRGWRKIASKLGVKRS